MLMGRYIFLIYLNGSTRSQAYWGLFKSWLRCLEMNLQSSLVLLFQHPIHHSRQQGHQMLPTCQACQVGFLHTHPGTLPILVVNQAVLNHLVVSILTQQVPSTLPASCDHCWSQWSQLVTVSEDTVGASLSSAVSDRLRWWKKEEMDCAQAELSALKRAEEHLKKGTGNSGSWLPI